jgi:hypothetical protein
MLTTLVLALLIQTSCVVVLLLYVRQKWMLSAGFVFVVTAWTYHAASEILNNIFPNRNAYRTLLTPEEIGTAALWCSAVMASFTAAYLLSRPYRTRYRVTPPDRIASVLDDWRILMFLAMPIYLLALSPTELRADGYWGSGMMEQFTVIVFVLTSLALTKHASWRYVTAVMCGQAVLLIFMGSRTTMWLTSIMFLASTIRRRQTDHLRLTAVAVGLVLAAGIVISAARATVGRDTLISDATSRAIGIRSGIRALSNPRDLIDTLLDDSVYRLDGNSFAALVVDRLQSGSGHLGSELVVVAARLAVPSFIFPSKMDLSVEGRNEKALIVTHFGLFRDIDYVPTLLSVLLATFGFVGGVGAGAVLGLGYGWADRRLSRSSSALVMLFSLGLLQCALQTEQAVVVYFVVFRGVMVIAVAAFLVDRLRVSLRKHAAVGVARA